jgi:hypothetical protein
MTLALLLVFGAGLFAGVGAGPAAVVSSATFTDPAGDGQGAPDIQTVTASDEAGLVSITVAAADLRANTRINVYLNTDKTGGFDYWLHYQKGTRNWLWNVSRWSGSAWQRVPQSNTTSITPGDNVCVFRLSTADLGGTSGFRFNVETVLFDPVSKTATARDHAPDSGTWLYSLGVATTTTTTGAATTAMTTSVTTAAAEVMKPVIGAPILVPATPSAGTRLTVAFPITRSDTGSPLRLGKMEFNPSVGNRVIPHSESFKNGVARATFTVPITAKGKLLKVKITIKAENRLATKVTSFKIR